MRIVIFDLETRKGTNELSEDNDYAWTLLRAGEGGISALCIYDFTDNWLHLFDDNPLSIRAAVARLEEADVVVGYRSEGFDLPCAEGIWGRRLRIKSHVDLYALIARTNAHKGIVGRRGDFTLDAVCRRTFAQGKIGHGAFAPDLVKQGRWGELYNYCAHDVRLTRELLLHIVRDGGIVDHNHSILKLQLPANVLRELHDQAQKL